MHSLLQQQNHLDPSLLAFLHQSYDPSVTSQDLLESEWWKGIGGLDVQELIYAKGTELLHGLRNSAIRDIPSAGQAYLKSKGVAL